MRDSMQPAMSVTDALDPANLLLRNEWRAATARLWFSRAAYRTRLVRDRKRKVVEAYRIAGHTVHGSLHGPALRHDSRRAEPERRDPLDTDISE